MQKKSKQRKGKVTNLAIITTMSAVVLIMSTYAWFIALDEVRVDAFNVSIAPTEGLELSLDGATWFGGLEAVGSAAKKNLEINSGNYDTGAYAGHTNSWTGIKTAAVGDGEPEFWGLIPMSSSGQINDESSRLVLYDKTSLTSADLVSAGDLSTTEWGYRLASDPVPNTGTEEYRGYIAFDLFVKNVTETGYYEEVDIQNEEAIYLTVDSAVTGGATGAGGYGIENSARVAFAQIARTQIPTDDGSLEASEAAALKCSGGEATVAGSICRPAVIWEPNDTKHTANAIDFYNTNCSKRPYGESKEACETFTGTTPTYAVTQKIEASDVVDIYDGVYNTFTETTTGSDSALPLLQNMHIPTLLSSYASKDATNGGIGYYFTDTMKDTGITRDADGSITTADQDTRPPFMYLAPNSITKVRVYVWIEGQDIDNYDWASKGDSINVNFGFTKQQLSNQY